MRIGDGNRYLDENDFILLYNYFEENNGPFLLCVMAHGVDTLRNDNYLTLKDIFSTNSAELFQELH